jgi:hypothetical protein
MNEEKPGIQDSLFSIEEALSEAASEQKALTGCDLCQHCFFIRFMRLHRLLGTRESVDSLNFTMPVATPEEG